RIAELRRTAGIYGRQRFIIHTLLRQRPRTHRLQFYRAGCWIRCLRGPVVEPERAGPEMELHLVACGDCVWRVEDTRVQGTAFVRGAAGMSCTTENRIVASRATLEGR